MKHLKTLGLAALAVVALTALVGVSSASATEFHATGGTALNGVVVEGEPHEFTIEESSVTCNVISFNGTAAAGGTSTTQNMRPTYNTCKAFGIVNAVINTNNCEYEFSANANTANLHGCTSPINIVANSFLGNCKVTVGNQNGINGQTFTNMGNTGSNTATLTEKSAATNIVANVTESNGVCPLNTGVKNNAAYNGGTGIMGATGGTSF
ncbi:MAG TPA: hypothetical protein VFS26_05785 [Solirubrobacterales bacterium]|nr:hypothetical protein [Solirubrobacterales bacterium]